MIVPDPSLPHRLEVAEGAVYLLRVPTVADRARFRRAVRKAKGRRHGVYELLDILEDGVRAIVPKAMEQHLAVVTDYRAQLQAFQEQAKSRGNGQATETLKPPAIFREIERVVEDHYEPYLDAVADNAAYPYVVGEVATRMFLIGREGWGGELSEQVLAQIPSWHMFTIGAEVESLLEPNQDDLKNSPSPSGGRRGHKPSSGTQTQPQSTH